jgi:hypothetical protein
LDSEFAIRSDAMRIDQGPVPELEGNFLRPGHVIEAPPHRLGNGWCMEKGGPKAAPSLFEWPATRLIPEKLFDPPELRFSLLSELGVIRGFIVNGV